MRAAALGSFAAGGLTLLATRDPRRTADVLLAGLPRAAWLGRDGFAAQVGRTLAQREVLPMDPRVLRRHDEVDTVIVDAELLVTGRFVVAEIVPVLRDDETSYDSIVGELFDPGTPEASVQRAEWSLRPVTAVGDEPAPPGLAGLVVAELANPLSVVLGAGAEPSLGLSSPWTGKAPLLLGSIHGVAVHAFVLGTSQRARQNTSPLAASGRQEVTGRITRWPRSSCTCVPSSAHATCKRRAIQRLSSPVARVVWQ